MVWSELTSPVNFFAQFLIYNYVQIDNLPTTDFEFLWVGHSVSHNTYHTSCILKEQIPVDVKLECYLFDVVFQFALIATESFDVRC